MAKMKNEIPKVFFAYPSSQPTLKESIQVAVEKLNKAAQVKIETWEECNGGGNFVCNTICNAIDESELFCADLTGLNANVMFELGYAIASEKRIWLILDITYTEEKELFDQLKILSTLEYVSCCNSEDILTGFDKHKPIADLENTIFRAGVESSQELETHASILYLKSQHDNEAAVSISRFLNERFSGRIIVDDIRESPVQALTCYAMRVTTCDTVICHFTNPKREGAHVQTARHALGCGMAHGLKKPFMMLAEGHFLSATDYRDYLRNYDTASEALSYLRAWLDRIGEDWTV